VHKRIPKFHNYTYCAAGWARCQHSFAMSPGILVRGILT
jgi:hypothetical protein